MRSTRFRSFGLLAIAALVAFMVAGCGDSSEGPEGNSSSGDTTEVASGCEEVNALKDSLTSLMQIEPVADGVDALKSASTEVKTDLEAAASAVSSELQPSVDEVQAAFDELESTLEGISSSGGLGAAATEVGNELTQLGSALTDLSTEISDRC